MLNELRRLFIAALVCHDEEDAMILIDEWNAEIERLQKVFDMLTDKVPPKEDK